MNVCLYLRHFSPQGDNLTEGLKKAVHGLATGLAHSGAAVTVLCEGEADASVDAPGGYKIRCFGGASTRPFRLAPGLRRFVESLAGKDTLFVVNGIFHPSVSTLAKLLRKHGIRYVVAPHDPYHPAIFQKNAHLKWPYWYLFEKRVLAHAAAVQVLDGRHASFLRDLGVRTPVVETPNGFSPSDVHPETGLRFTHQGPAKLFFLGRIDAHNKGLDLLVEAFAGIDRSLDVTLTLQGPDWGDRESLQEEARSFGVADRVTFAGPDFVRSAADIMNDHDVFCLPSRFEGFGLSALEAMLAGRVLLISDVAGLTPHVVAAGCGIGVKPEVEAIRNGLLSLLQKRAEWQAMGLAGRKYVLENLGWDKIAAAAMEQYKRLVS